MCSWLNLEDGVLLKYSEEATRVAAMGTYIWRKIDSGIPITYTISRFAQTPPNNWRVIIVQGTCFAIATLPQSVDDDIPVDHTFSPVPFFGSCDDDNPVGSLRMQSYDTIDDALADYPDLQNWDWPAY